MEHRTDLRDDQADLFNMLADNFLKKNLFFQLLAGWGKTLTVRVLCQYLWEEGYNVVMIFPTDILKHQQQGEWHGIELNKAFKNLGLDRPMVTFLTYSEWFQARRYLHKDAVVIIDEIHLFMELDVKFEDLRACCAYNSIKGKTRLMGTSASIGMEKAQERLKQLLGGSCVLWSRYDKNQLKSWCTFVHNGGGKYGNYIGKKIHPRIRDERKLAPVIVLLSTKDHWRYHKT